MPDASILALPDGVGLATLAALMAASFFGSFVTVALGIGGGILLLAFMASLMPPAALIPVHGFIQLGSNAGRLVLFRRSVSWPALPAFAAGSVAGAALGGSVVVALPPPAVQIGVGAFVIWSVFARPPRWLGRWPWLAGGISSFLTMFFGATGPFVAVFVKSLNLARHAHVATHAAAMTLQHLLKVVVFGFLGFAFGDWWAVILLMILAGLLGTFSGRHVLNRLQDHHFKQVLDVVLVLIAIRLILKGLGIV